MTQIEFLVNPPNLRGLNRLAQRLNELRSCGDILDWHLGGWIDGKKTKHGILFDQEQDATLAKAKIGLSHVSLGLI